MQRNRETKVCGYKLHLYGNVCRSKIGVPNKVACHASLLYKNRSTVKQLVFGAHWKAEPEMWGGARLIKSEHDPQAGLVPQHWINAVLNRWDGSVYRVWRWGSVHTSLADYQRPAISCLASSQCETWPQWGKKTTSVSLVQAGVKKYIHKEFFKKVDE